MSKEIESHVLEHFEVVHFMGSGAYGHVWKVRHLASGQEYALKKIFDAFQNEVDAQRTYRQVSILWQLNHQNIIKLEWVIRAHNNRDLYLVFQLMEIDLHSLLGENVLTPTHILFVAYQMLKALKYLHSAHLVHRDLKSSNVLINANCEIKIIDFGLVRSLVKEEHSQLVLSEDVATRWYRSPEMLLGSQAYGKPTDMWSLGCMLAQVVNGKPLFPGESTSNQLEKILQFTGAPNLETLKGLGSPAYQFVFSEIRVKKRPISHFFSGCERDIFELIMRMLEMNPLKRITAEEALQLPCFQEFRGKSPEPVCESFVVPALDDNHRLEIKDYRKVITQDIQRRYPDMNKITPMPRIIRAHHSLISRKAEQPRKATNSLVKLQSVKYEEKEEVHPANRIYRKQYKRLNPHQKQNEYVKEYYNLRSTGTGTGTSGNDNSKLFKRKRPNLWIKG